MKVQLDKDGFYTGKYVLSGDLEGSVETECLPPFATMEDQLCYEYKDEKWVYSDIRAFQLYRTPEEEKAENNIEIQIKMLQKELEETDYKVIKAMEYQLNGLSLPYDIKELYDERQKKRDLINLKQNQIEEIKLLSKKD